MSDLRCSRSISSRSQRVIEAIRRHFRDTGGSPCHREIAARVGMPRQHVGAVLTKLQRAGALTYSAGRSRSITLVDRAGMLSDAELELACHARGWQVR